MNENVFNNSVFPDGDSRNNGDQVRKEQATSLSKARKVFSHFMTAKENPDFRPTQNEVDDLWKSINLIMLHGSKDEANALADIINETRADNKEFFKCPEGDMPKLDGMS